METTLLLVDPDQLPRQLEDLLVAKGVFVETTTAEELEHAVIAVAPDLVVGARSQKLGRVLGVLGRQDPVVQLVLLADWKEHKELRARRDPVIGALLSRDTPASLLAGRIAEFGVRAARGQPLQQTPSLVPPRTADKPPVATEREAGPPTATKGPISGTTRTAGATSLRTTATSQGSSARTPGVSGPSALRASGGGKGAFSSSLGRSPGGLQNTPRQPAAVAKRTLIGIPAPAAATAEARSLPVHGPASSEPTPAQVATKPPAEASRPVSRTEPEAEPTTLPSESPPRSESRPQLESRPQPDPRPEVERGPQGRGEPAGGVRGGGDDVDELWGNDDEAAGSAEGVASDRVPLTFSRRPLPPLRLALVDTDLTRAGVIAEELRGRGVTTQLVAPELDATRWHLLRRFAPHGLVMDEESVGAHAKWLETIRLDPFLSHVPLVVAPLGRVFRESTGRADTSLLVPLLLSMGTEEGVLRDPVRASQTLELRLDQIGTICLLEVLGERARPTRLEASDGEVRLRWQIGQRRAGAAELARGEGPGEPLAGPQALDWLLAHPESRIVVREAPDVQLSSATAILLEELIESATAQEVIPASPPPRSVRSSRRPPQPEGALADRVPAEGGGDETPLGARLQAAALQAKAWGVTNGVRVLRSWREVTPRVRYATLGVGAALVGVLGYLGFGGSSAEAEPRAEVQAPESPPAPPVVDESPPPPSKAQADGPEDQVLLFQVAREGKLPACDDASVVAGESASAAGTYLQRARQQLVVGSTDNARELMCKAALLDPAGPASEGLAQLYLAGRSLENAHHWAETSLRHNPDRRTTKELLGDIASQRGQVKDARSILLETMQLTGDETAKLEAVSRNQVREGTQAIKSRDLPRAERLFRRSITLDPKNAAAAVGLTQVYLELGDREAARRWARHAIRLDPNSASQLPADVRE